MKRKLPIQFSFSTLFFFKERLQLSCSFNLKFILILIISLFYTSTKAQTKTHPFPADGSIELPAGIDEVNVEAWGAGGAGGGATSTVLVGRGGGGGGGGAYAKGKITTSTPQTLSIFVGKATTGAVGNGASGGASYIASYTSVFNAAGGTGGLANNGGTPTGGLGGTTIGGTGSEAGLPGKDGSSGVLSLLAVFGAGAGGDAGNIAGGGGRGGDAISSLLLGNSVGNDGKTYGGGGSGGLASLGASHNGGTGARGHLIITYSCKTYSLSTIKASTACTTTGTSLVEFTGTPTSLPKGNYVATYNTSSATGQIANFTVGTAGVGSFTASGLNTVGNSTITITTLASMDCSSTITANNVVTIAVTARPTIALSAIPGVCRSTNSQNVNLPYTATTNVPTNYSIAWNASPANNFVAVNNATLPASQISIAVPAGTGATTYTGTLTVSNAGCVSINYPISVVVNALPVAPTASATQQPTCAVNTGTITVTSPASGTGFSYSIDGTTFTNTTGVFANLTTGPYNVSVRNNSTLCQSPSTAVTINPVVAKIWNGSSSANWATPANWTPTGVPLASDCVTIPPMTTNPIISGTNGTFFANRITIQNNGSLIVQSSNTLTVTNEVNVLGTGSFVFENNSSLVQISEAVNSGNITYKRDSKPVRRYDATYWSSPVTRVPAFTLQEFSPFTLLDKYYRFDPNNGWTIILNGTEEMVKGNGYNIRAPQSFDTTIPNAIYGGVFIGVPNNGTILGPTAVATKGNLLGNPYPSAIYADRFIVDNAANYYGTLYFWTHNSLPVYNPADSKYYYNNNDFAVYNLSGNTNAGSMTGTGATTPGNQAPPLGYIAAGQGFFARSKTGQRAVFTNLMRVSGNNSQFFKSGQSEFERHRVWLNFTNTQGAFKQILIGYIEGATNLWDDNYDAETLNSNPLLDFYSINGTIKLLIQGRAIPFEESDTVPLGYRSSIAGDFTIAIERTDGNLSTQTIYLEDKATNKIQDLKAGAYTFTTAIGVFNERFVLRYTNKNLETNNFASLDKNVFVSVKDKNIKLQAVSDTENLKETAIYDVGGKLLYQKENINNKELLITNLPPVHQVLLVKITLDNGYTTTKKIVF
ncbi:T9SS sorting signal type C domain-containing protein [Flavobacterium chungbukense]|uniref:Glycine-rich domain-containing protein n=1 Tax=Flavobacterium chungbukense TaxID=877464 RepID=A0ABP7Y281_9FLAO|nr:T9SS sorting signal type C domain-containing protein [Flavobacterium chungbukense]MCC4922229.1 T9SS sorting signal type C domain-containing protein [Flavobacterium chungbukense]